MARLNLVIADVEEGYAKGLSEYISSCHTSVFSVSCFTRVDAFLGFMERKPLVDVLLVSPEFYEISAGYDSIRLRLLLSDGSLKQEYHGFQTIEKFNTGEKLLSDILHLYSVLDSEKVKLSEQSRAVRTISVYSPAGGTGKTTIAAAMAIQSSDKGMRSFYLNLEPVHSTGIFFETKSARNLSYVFYYLKEKSNNLSMRLEGIKSKDARTGVDYFSPPESLFEYGEIDADDLGKLVNGIKGMGCYDYIFIDMPCAFDRRSQRVMNLCDQIITVISEESASMLKYNLFKNELERLEASGGGSITDKLLTVTNLYKERGEGIPGDQSGAASGVYHVPEYGRTLINENGTVTVDDDGFRKAISILLDAVSDK